VRLPEGLTGEVMHDASEIGKAGNSGIARANLFSSVSGALVGQSTSYRIRMPAGGPQPRGSGAPTSYRLKIGW
jgi:hypothetical protein